MTFTTEMTPAQMKRDLAERMIELIVHDEAFRTNIVDDPLQAMKDANLVEDHDTLVDAVATDPQAQSFAAFGLGLTKLAGAEDEVVYPTWVLGPTCSAKP